MRKFVRIIGASAKEMQLIFKRLQRIRRSNLPYPQDSKMAAICGVTTFNWGTNPDYQAVSGSFLPFMLPFPSIL